MILFFISSPPWLKERKNKKIPLSRRLPSCELVSAAAADGKFSSLPLKTGSFFPITISPHPCKSNISHSQKSHGPLTQPPSTFLLWTAFPLHHHPACWA